MRSVLALVLLIALCASADAKAVHRPHRQVIVGPNQSVTTPPAGSLAIPGLDPGRGWSHAG
jgi:hypothetical protein